MRMLNQIRVTKYGDCQFVMHQPLIFEKWQNLAIGDLFEYLPEKSQILNYEQI